MCETGCFDSAITTTTTSTTTSTTTTTTSTTTSTTAPLGGCDSSRLSDSQYCFTVPDSYYYYDYYDYNDYWYHGIEEIYIGGVITMSRTCAPDYHIPAGYYMKEDNFGDYGCDYFADLSPDCKSWYGNELLAFAAHTANGYITALNCPQCGCTENDIIRLDERNAGTRTMSGGRAALKAKLEELRQKKLIHQK